MPDEETIQAQPGEQTAAAESPAGDPQDGTPAADGDAAASEATNESTGDGDATDEADPDGGGSGGDDTHEADEEEHEGDATAQDDAAAKAPEEGAEVQGPPAPGSDASS